jgi:hypothetical protein
VYEYILRYVLFLEERKHGKYGNQVLRRMDRVLVMHMEAITLDECVILGHLRSPQILSPCLM